MLFTLIVIALLLVAVVGGYFGWCQYAQRDQRPGRHRMTDRETSPTAA